MLNPTNNHLSGETIMKRILYNTPQKLDRAIRWMLGCHKPKGKGKYGREYAKES